MATLNVTSYKDNPDGTTTNFLSDGSSDTGTYTPNKDGSLNFNPISSSNVITPESLAPVTPIQGLPTTPVTTEAPKQTPIDYDAMFGLTDFQKQAEQTQETGISEIIKNMGLLQNEATDLQAERQKQGLQDKYRENQATKARILALDAEMQQDDIVLAQKMRNEERRDTLLPFAQMGQAKLAGDAAIYRGLKTAEKNTLISQQLAQQGDIALAEQFAKDAIDAKYAPYKQNIENYKTILEIIKPSLTAAENKRLKAQEAKVTSAENEIKKAEENEKATKNLQFTLMQNQAPQSLINTANKAQRIEDIMKIPGISKYLISQSDRLDIAIKSQTLQDKKDAAKALEQAKKSGIITKEQAEKATDLRKEYNGLQPVKDVDKSETDTKAILNALKGGKPTDDIAAINSFQRIAVDPGVSVREGDVALLQTANSFGDKAWLRTNGYLKGDKLTSTAREAMQDLVLKIHDSRIGSVQEKTIPLRKTAEVYGVDFDTYVANPYKNSQTIYEEVTKQQVPTAQKSVNYVTALKNTFSGQVSGTPFDALFTPVPTN